jgi:hypothetical protein
MTDIFRSDTSMGKSPFKLDRKSEEKKILHKSQLLDHPSFDLFISEAVPEYD